MEKKEKPIEKLVIIDNLEKECRKVDKNVKIFLEPEEVKKILEKE
jgi:hypothetical protein